MSNIHHLTTEVKEFEGAFGPDGEDTAIQEWNRSAPSGPSGLSASIPQSPDGFKAQNSPAKSLPLQSEDPIEPPGVSGHPTSLESLHRYISASDSARRMATVFATAGQRAKAESFLRCGEHVYTLACEKCGFEHKVGYNCKLRICARCASVKTAALEKKYLPYAKKLACRRRPYLRRLDLTLKNVEDLAKGVERLRVSFTKLRHRKDYLGKFDGGIYGVEAKPGNDGKWNIHMHVLYCGSWLAQERLSAHWKDITGDSMILHIKAVTDVQKALGYVLKYVTKGVENPEDWTQEELAQFVLVLENVRLVQAFGCFIGQMWKKEPFYCPDCGFCLWRRVDSDGQVSYSPIASLLREYRKSRQKIPLMVTLTRAV